MLSPSENPKKLNSKNISLQICKTMEVNSRIYAHTHTHTHTHTHAHIHTHTLSISIISLSLSLSLPLSLSLWKWRGRKRERERYRHILPLHGEFGMYGMLIFTVLGDPRISFYLIITNDIPICAEIRTVLFLISHVGTAHFVHE